MGGPLSRRGTDALLDVHVLWIRIQCTAHQCLNAVYQCLTAVYAERDVYCIHGQPRGAITTRQQFNCAARASF